MADESVRKRFAERLRLLIAKRGLNQSELARSAALHLPPDTKLTRGNISTYVRARVLPSDKYLTAIAKALGVDPDELLPERGLTRGQSTPLALVDNGDGMAHLTVSQVVPTAVALRILGILAAHQAAIEGGDDETY